MSKVLTAGSAYLLAPGMVEPEELRLPAGQTRWPYAWDYWEPAGPMPMMFDDGEFDSPIERRVLQGHTVTGPQVTINGREAERRALEGHPVPLRSNSTAIVYAEKVDLDRWLISQGTEPWPFRELETEQLAIIDHRSRIVHRAPMASASPSVAAMQWLGAHPRVDPRNHIVAWVSSWSSRPEPHWDNLPVRSGRHPGTVHLNRSVAFRLLHRVGWPRTHALEVFDWVHADIGDRHDWMRLSPRFGPSGLEVRLWFRLRRGVGGQITLPIERPDHSARAVACNLIKQFEADLVRLLGTTVTEDPVLDRRTGADRWRARCVVCWQPGRPESHIRCALARQDPDRYGLSTYYNPNSVATARGADLDRLATMYGLERHQTETERQLRERVIQLLRGAYSRGDF